MDNSKIYDHPAYRYALGIHNGDIVANDDVKIVTERFLKEVDDSLNDKGDYYFDLKSLDKVSKLLKLIKMATGPKKRQPVYDSLAGFQWFFLVNIFCWRYKDDHSKRRYSTVTLLIARKNGKRLAVLKSGNIGKNLLY